MDWALGPVVADNVGMAKPSHTMILHAGGLRSLLTTAMVLNQAQKTRLTLLFVHDGRPTNERRLEYVRRQADYYNLAAIDELALTGLFDQPSHIGPDGRPRAVLSAPRLLLPAVAHAAERRVTTLHWPIAHDARPTDVARASEQQLLVSQIAETEVGVDMPTLETALLGYDDQQLIELGAGLGVPWELAWSCAMEQSRPCGACPPCRRRADAFRAAGVLDPATAVSRNPVAARA